MTKLITFFCPWFCFSLYVSMEKTTVRAKFRGTNVYEVNSIQITMAVYAHHIGLSTQKFKSRQRPCKLLLQGNMTTQSQPALCSNSKTAIPIYYTLVKMTKISVQFCSLKLFDFIFSI